MTTEIISSSQMTLVLYVTGPKWKLHCLTKISAILEESWVANGQSFVGRLISPLCEVTGQRKEFSP